jgi:hypothetical protein
MPDKREAKAERPAPTTSESQEVQLTEHEQGLAQELAQQLVGDVGLESAERVSAVIQFFVAQAKDRAKSLDEELAQAAKLSPDELAGLGVSEAELLRAERADRE